MALASLGALLAMSLTAAVNLRQQRNLACDWHESLRIERSQPPGEDGLKALPAARARSRCSDPAGPAQ